MPPQPPCFCLGIWSDTPAQGGNYSYPAQLLCNNCFSAGQYTYFIRTNGVNERFFDTSFSAFSDTDVTIWEYVFDLPTNTPCIQTIGGVYWLSLWADCFDTNQFAFGWKTSSYNWNDDAVVGHLNVNGVPLGDWNELRRPPNFTNSMDLAFHIVTDTNYTPAITNKWLQIPDTSTNGLDVRVTDPKILANDFLCTQTGPITQIRIWGSWLNDRVPTNPPCFCLGIWNDVPTNGILKSHPGYLICSNCFSPCEYKYFAYSNCVSEKFYDPNIPGIIGSDTTIWEYVFDWPTNNQCWQTNGTIYWLSAWADCIDTNYLFGWKTSPTNWNDDAVYGHVDTNGYPLMDWAELTRYPSTQSLDLAFEIFTATNPPVIPPPPTNSVKWLQIPDTSTLGEDVSVTGTNIMADDFRCTQTGPITQVRIWGSWLNDHLPQTPPCFCLGFWNDVPVSATNFFSHPGQLLCSPCIQPCNYRYYAYTNCVYEQFFQPGGSALGNDTTIWEYIFDISTNACFQTNGNIYWLSVQADCFDANLYQFGWKTCPTNWNDDAVYGGTASYGSPVQYWVDLHRPVSTNSLDMAFEIITQTNPCPPIALADCPPNLTLQKCVPWTFGSPPLVITNCCGNSYTLTNTTTTNNVDVCHQIVTRVWTVTDCHGGTASCTQTVSLVDTAPPAFTCATNKTVCGLVWGFDPPIALSDFCCTNVAVSILSTVTNGCLATRVWQVSDCCSNSAVCSQTVLVIGTNRPTLICPTNITVITCSSNVIVSWSITASNICKSVTVTSAPPSGSLFNRGSTNTVIATATDPCGNTTNCSFLVIVRKPTLTIGVGSGLPPTNVIVSWVDGGVLEDATNIVGLWTPRPLATSPYTNAITTVQRFYRLRCP